MQVYFREYENCVGNTFLKENVQTRFLQIFILKKEAAALIRPHNSLNGFSADNPMIILSCGMSCQHNYV